MVFNSELYKFTELLHKNPTANYAVVRLLIKMKYYNQNHREHSRLSICKESLSTVPIVIYAQKNSVFLDEFNAKIEMFKSSGLIDHWYHKFIDKYPINVQTLQPISLKIRHVKAGIVVILIGGALSLPVFIVELLSNKLYNVLNLRSYNKSRFY